MCRLSLRFEYYFVYGHDFHDIKSQLATVKFELKNKLNFNTDFINVEIEKCCIGLSGHCTKYKFNHFRDVYVFTVIWDVRIPHYRLCMRKFAI